VQSPFLDDGFSAFSISNNEKQRSQTQMELPPESGPPTGIDYPSNWRISDGWKTREAGRDCIEASAG
jgi:hypothetical protein